MGLEITNVVNSTVQIRRKPLTFASSLQENLEELLDKSVMNRVAWRRADRRTDRKHQLD